MFDCLCVQLVHDQTISIYFMRMYNTNGSLLFLGVFAEWRGHGQLISLACLFDRVFRCLQSGGMTVQRWRTLCRNWAVSVSGGNQGIDARSLANWHSGQWGPPENNGKKSAFQRPPSFWQHPCSLPCYFADEGFYSNYSSFFLHCIYRASPSSPFLVLCSHFSDKYCKPVPVFSEGTWGYRIRRSTVLCMAGCSLVPAVSYSYLYNKFLPSRFSLL